MKISIFNIAFALFFCTASFVIGGEYETPVTGSAGDLQPAELLKGPHHTVRDEVISDGFTHTYVIDSDFGIFVAHGDDQLPVRVQEIHAIAACQEIRKSDSFVKGFGGQVKEEGEIAVGVVKHPVQSITGVPKGIGHFLNRAGTSIKEGGSTGSYKDGAVVDWLKVDEYKRQLAQKLHVSPYTDNEVLQHEMKEISTAGFLGGMGLRVLIPGDGLLLISKDGQGSDVIQSVYLEAPGDLFQGNRKALAAMGVSDEAANAFLADKDYNPAQQTILIQSLAKLGSPDGIDNFIRNATFATSSTDDHFFRRTAQLFALYHTKHEPIERIVDVYGFPGGITKSNKLVIPLSIDHGIWSVQAAQFADAAGRINFAGYDLTDRDLLISGSISEKADAGMESHGFTIIPHAFKRL